MNLVHEGKEYRSEDVGGTVGDRYGVIHHVPVALAEQ